MVGREKILYGSDFPLRLYPKQDKQPAMNRFLDQIRNDSGLKESCIQSILGGNAAPLFKISNVL
jgi:predicted TIM-barrel fold metal-dependent hydrolase